MISLMVGCAGQMGKTPMRQHFDAAQDAHDAVVSADLDGVRRAGAILASRDPDPMPGAPDLLLARMMERARELASDTVLEDAAQSMAQIGRICGDCHREMGSGPPVSEAGAPSEDRSDLGRHMERHSWAATRLWQGLIGPSDPVWMAGASVLDDAPMLPERMADRTWRIAAELEVRVHAMGERASQLKDVDERALLYGDLLMTCGACHQSVRGQP
jgi:cytochrome c553